MAGAGEAVLTEPRVYHEEQLPQAVEKHFSQLMVLCNVDLFCIEYLQHTRLHKREEEEKVKTERQEEQGGHLKYLSLH